MILHLLAKTVFEPVLLCGTTGLLFSLFCSRRNNCRYYVFILFFILYFVLNALFLFDDASSRYVCLMIIPFCITTAFLFSKTLPDFINYFSHKKSLLGFSILLLIILNVLNLSKAFREIRYGYFNKKTYTLIQDDITRNSIKKPSIYHFDHEAEVAHYTDYPIVPFIFEGQARFALTSDNFFSKSFFLNYHRDIYFVLKERPYASLREDINNIPNENGRWHFIGKITKSHNRYYYIVRLDQKKDSQAIHCIEETSETSPESIIFEETFSSYLPDDILNRMYNRLKGKGILLQKNPIIKFPQGWSINDPICRESNPFINISKSALINGNNALHIRSQSVLPVINNNEIPIDPSQKYSLSFILKGTPGSLFGWRLYKYRRESNHRTIELTSNHYVLCDKELCFYLFHIPENELYDFDTIRIEFFLVTGEAFLEKITFSGVDK